MSDTKNMPGSSPQHKKHTPRYQPPIPPTPPTPPGPPDAPNGAAPLRDDPRDNRLPLGIHSEVGPSGQPTVAVVVTVPEKGGREVQRGIKLSPEDAINMGVNMIIHAVTVDLYADLAKYLLTRGTLSAASLPEARGIINNFAHFRSVLLAQQQAIVQAASAPGQGDPSNESGEGEPTLEVTGV